MSQIKCSRHDCCENTAGRLAIMGPRCRRCLQGVHRQEGNEMGNVLFALRFRERDSEDETHVEDTIAIKSQICVPMRVQELQKGGHLSLLLLFATHILAFEQPCRA